MPELDIVRAVDDSDVVLDEKDANAGTYVCTACGASFESQRGLNVHAGHAHPDRPELQVKTGTRRSGTRRRKPSDFIVTETTDEKLAKWRGFIGSDVNNWLLMGASTPLVGISPITFNMRPPAFDGASVADKIKFSPLETELLAQAIVRLDGTPFGISLVTAATGIAPYALGIGVLFVLAIHSYAIWRLRNDLPSILAQQPEKAPSGNTSQSAADKRERTQPTFKAI